MSTTCLLDYMRAGVYLWVIRHNGNRQRSYQRKYTSSRPITEVKCVRAQIVLGWGTAWEHWVTLASLNFLLPPPCPGGRRQQDGWGTTHMLVFLYCDSSFSCRAGADRGNGVSLDFCCRAVSWSTLMVPLALLHSLCICAVGEW